MNDNFLLPGAGPWARHLREKIRARRIADESAYQVAGEHRPNDLSLIEAERICVRSAGDRLAHLRLRKGLTMDAAAKLTGISKSELSRLETGKRIVKNWHIVAFASAYGLTEEALRYVLACNQQIHAFMPDALQKNNIDLRQSYEMKRFYASHLIKSSNSADSSQISISVPFRFSTDSYCIVFDTPYSDSILPIGSLIIVDPKQRPLMGDIVLNRISWKPLIINLFNTAEGLAGNSYIGRVDFGRDIVIEDFHKIVAFITSFEMVTNIVNNNDSQADAIS
jgi:transcriptional regulator with XRE-family HTH domain